MEADVTQDEISKLPLAGKSVFATACTRIAWDGLARRQWPNPPHYLKGALLEVERLGRMTSPSVEEKAKLARVMSGLVARADMELDSQSTSAFVRSAREAVELVLLEQDAVNVQMVAAKHAYEAYRWALHATRTALLGAAAPAEREFQVKVREMFDALREDIPAPRTELSREQRQS